MLRRILLAGMLATILAILSSGADFKHSATAEETQAAIPSQQDWAPAKKQVSLPNGQKIAYVDLGDVTKPALLLVHGFTDNSRSWSLIAPHLINDFRLIAVDLRGHGKSSAPECCYTLPDMAYDLRLLLDQLEVERASVVGHSLGSMVAQVFAHRYPERLDKLVLVSSTVSASGLSGPGSWLWENIHQLKAPIDPNSQFMMDWYANPNPVNEEFLTLERSESAAVPLHVWKSVLYEFATSEYGRLSGQIAAPTLILWGEKDAFFDAASQDVLRKAMPNANYVSFDSLGHNIAWEQPKNTAEAISSFLKQ